MEGEFWFLDACRGLYNEMHTDIFTATGNEILSNANYIELL